MSIELSSQQTTALQAAQDYFGHWWKGKLKDCWMSATYPSGLEVYQADLQQIRNAIGPSGLNQVKL